MSTAKPVVLVDMDGPLADFDRLFFQRCWENGWEMDATYDTQTARYATEHIPDKNHRKLARAMVDSPGWFADLPVTRGAREGLYSLARHAEVWVCTKPLEANPTCRDDKGRWLRRNFGAHWERRLIIAPDKSVVAGHLLLDDAPFPEWLDTAIWNPVMFPTPWNGDGSLWDGIPRWQWGDDVEELVAHAHG